GPKSNNRYFGASWFAANPDEDSIMLAHTGPQFANAADSLGTIQFAAPVSGQDLARMQSALDEFSPDGWHTTVRVTKAGDSGVSSITVGGVGKSAGEFQEDIDDLNSSLSQLGLAIKSSDVQPAEIEFLGKDDVPGVLYGGPRGATRRGVQAG